MVVRLPEQQPVESGWRVIVRLPTTTAAFVTAACTNTVHGTAITTTAIAPAVTTKQQQGTADGATKRATTKRLVVAVAVAIVKLII